MKSIQLMDQIISETDAYFKLQKKWWATDLDSDKQKMITAQRKLQHKLDKYYDRHKNDRL